jgi:hypothetical protein
MCCQNTIHVSDTVNMCIRKLSVYIPNEKEHWIVQVIFCEEMERKQQI